MDPSDKLLRLIASNFDVAPLLVQLEAHPELWSVITARQTTPGSPHHDTECIFIRGPQEQTVEAIFNDLEAVDYPAANVATDVWLLLAAINQELKIKTLGRVMIVSLKPAGKIDRHFDDGAYAAHYSRYHLCLQSDEGNAFEVEDEAEHMRPGELWWFNHRTWHSVRNDSARPRVHLIVDAVVA